MFKVGDKVCQKIHNRRQSIYTGTIFSIVDGEKETTYVVEWAYGSMNKVPQSNLVSEEDARLAIDSFQKEFENKQELLREKVARAAEALREVNEAASQLKIDVREMSDDIIGSLNDQVVEAGWYYSSASC